MIKQRAVILLSGGPDSATSLFVAKNRGYECHALTINYNQRAQAEILAAKNICTQADVHAHHFVDINLSTLQNNALIDKNKLLPGYSEDGIPVSYVPSRNIIFLSVACSIAETIHASDIFIGAHIIDYSNYPDCRPAFFDAFTKMMTVGTQRGIELGENAFKIHTPLIQLNKAEIFLLGQSLGLDLSETISCYDADDKGRACGVCASCELRREGFLQAGMVDQTQYR